MANYKIIVSKDDKKYNLVLKADNELAARERVHKEWYSILTIQEIWENENIWQIFVFEWYKDWELKNWKITWNDIFKAYTRLKELWYKIDYLYSEQDKNLSLDQKQRIIDELKESYEITTNKKKVDNKPKSAEFGAKEKVELKNFYLNKELEETNKLIDKTLQKLDNIFAGNGNITLTAQIEQKLRYVYNEIIKLKKSTNISKLREVGELALEKIWELELIEVQKNKNKVNSELLKDTNKLLKEFGSKTQFVDKKSDISFQLKSVLNNIWEVFSAKDEKKKKLDKDSYEYVKSYLYLTKYKQRLSANTKFIIQNLFKVLFDSKLREDTFLKRDVIKQNITILKAKLNWVNISYTYLKKWIFKLLESIVSFFKSISYSLFIVILVYTITFILYFYVSLKFSLPDYNFNWLSAFLIIIFTYFSIYFAKNIWTFAINFAILYFIIIFGLVNF